MIILRVQLIDGRSVTGRYIRHTKRSLVLERWGLVVVVPLIKIQDVLEPCEPETCMDLSSP